MLARLFLKRTDKQGWFRQVVNIFAVSLAFTVLLSALTFGQAIVNSGDRQIWVHNIAMTSDKKNPSIHKDEALARPLPQTAIKYGTSRLDASDNFIQIGLYQLSSKSPLLPGLERQPEYGEVMINQATADALKTDKNLQAQLKGYKQTIINVDKLISSPAKKVVFYKLPQKQVDNDILRYFDIDRLATMNQRELGTIDKIVNTVMTIGGLGVSFPLFMLMIAATRIGILQRQNRYSALSLIGATKGQINKIILAETLLSSALGLGIGYVLYEVARWTILPTFLTTDRYFMEDLTLPIQILAGLIALILVLITFINFIAVHKSKTSPLSVARQAEIPKKVGFWRLLPLLAIIAFWVSTRTVFKEFFDSWNQNYGQISKILAFMMLFTMLALIISGPYLTHLVSKIMQKLGHQPSVIMASRRLDVFAKPITSSVIGIVLALFAGSAFTTFVSIGQHMIEKEYAGALRTQRAVGDMVNDRSLEFSFSLPNEVDLKVLSKSIKNQLANSKYSKWIEKIAYEQSAVISLSGVESEKQYYNVISCEDLTWRTQLKCSGDQTGKLAMISSIVNNEGGVDRFKIAKIVKATDYADKIKTNYNSFLLKIRVDANKKELTTKINNDFAYLVFKEGASYYIYNNNSLLDEIDPLKMFQPMIKVVYVATFLTILVGGFSLAVATIGSFFERKRSFYTLRLMGVEMKTLNRTVMTEAVVPMVILSLVAIGSGISYAILSLRIVDNRFESQIPSISYFGLVVAALVISLIIIYSLLPILKRITNLDQNRTE